MNVLMFGWEFPPNISGGLGTACYGIVKGLSACGNVNITFVVPKTFGNEQTVKENFNLISAADVLIPCENSAEIKPGKLSFIEVSSRLTPYLTPESFGDKYQFTVSSEVQTEIIKKGYKISFTGKYGPDLFDEINNYAIVAQAIAQQNQFELIHAHDWLTFPAGIAAKQTSGKPLIVHSILQTSIGAVDRLTLQYMQLKSRDSTKLTKSSL